MYGSSKIISGTFILRIQLLIIIGVSIQLKFKHFKKCLNNTFHCGFRQWIRCQMHVPFFKRNNLRAFSLFYMFLISIAMWMLSAPPPPPLWRDSHAERKETPWWVMRITKSKYTRGKMPPSPPACRVQGSVCSLERCGFWPRAGHDRRTGSVWWWSESQANIQFQKHLWNEFILIYWQKRSRGSGQQEEYWAWLVPVVRNILVILLPPPPLASLHLHQ